MHTATRITRSSGWVMIHAPVETVKRMFPTADYGSVLRLRAIALVSRPSGASARKLTLTK